MCYSKLRITNEAAKHKLRVWLAVLNFAEFFNFMQFFNKSTYSASRFQEPPNKRDGSGVTNFFLYVHTLAIKAI